MADQEPDPKRWQPVGDLPAPEPGVAPDTDLTELVPVMDDPSAPAPQGQGEDLDSNGQWAEGQGVYPNGGHGVDAGDYADGDLADGDLADGDLADATFIDGEDAEGQYADGEYIDGEYAEGQYADGEYIEGEYAEGEYGGYAEDDYGDEYAVDQYGDGQYPEGDAQTGVSSKNVLAWTAAGLLIVVLAVGLITALLALRDSRKKESVAPATVISTSTTAAPPPRGTIDLPGGIKALVPDSSLSASASLQGTLTEMPSSLGDNFAAVSPFIDVSVVDGEQTGPIELVFPIGPGDHSPVAGEPVLYGIHQHDAKIEVLASVYNREARTLRVSVDKFSTIGVVTWRWDRIEQGVEAAYNTVTGIEGLGEWSCGGASAADTVTIANSGEMSWCAELNPTDGSRIVRGRNDNRFAVEVALDQPLKFEVVDDSPMTVALDRMANWDSATSTVLGPGGVINITVPYSATAQITTSFANTAVDATWTRANSEVLAAMAKLVPDATQIRDGDEVLDHLTNLGCAEVNGEGTARAKEIMNNCFSPAAVGDWFGAGTTGYLQELRDGDVLGELALRAADKRIAAIDKASTSTVSVVGARTTVWPIRDSDASADFLAAFAKADPSFKAGWTSCYQRFCLGGNGVEVKVLEKTSDGSFKVLGSVSEGSVNPAGALAALGLSQADINGLLTPGPLAPPTTTTTTTAPPASSPTGGGPGTPVTQGGTGRP